MSFLARAFGAGGVELEPRAITSSHLVPTIAEDAVLQGTAPGKAMSLTAFNACVCLLADSVAGLSGSAYRKKVAARELLDPQPTLFNENSPYPDTTWFEWIWMVMESLAVTGNAATLVTARDKYDRATALMPLHPDILTVDIPKRTKWPEPVFRIDGTKVRPGTS